MKEPLVSIVMPAYNAERYISEAINGVLSQTHENWELLITDDGSTDETATVVQAFRDKRIMYFYQKNQGQSAARNTSLGRANGKYIAFLDADDIFLPQKLERQVAFLESRPECDFSYSKIEYFWDGEPEKRYVLNIDHPSGHLKDDLIRRGGHLMAPISVMFRREWYDQYGGFGSEFRRSDEYFFYLKMALHGARFCYLDEVLALNRLNRWSLTRNEAHLKETAEANIAIFAWLDKELPPDDPSRKWLPHLRTAWQLRLALGFFILKDKRAGLRELKKFGLGRFLFPLFKITPVSWTSSVIKRLRRYRERSFFSRIA